MLNTNKHRKRFFRSPQSNFVSLQFVEQTRRLIAWVFFSSLSIQFYSIKADPARCNFINLDTSQKEKFIELKAQQCS